jgi:DNA-binding NarL/FixJ family response regulator
VRILIADDHPISRSGLEFLLAGEADVEVIGSAADGEAVIELATELVPDVVILDLMLPKTPGLVALAKLRRLDPPPAVVAISGQASGVIFQRALDAGAAALVSKEDPSEEILAALRAIARGDSYRSEKVAALLGRLVADGPVPALTTREQEVLALVAAGLSNDQIGAKLSISPRTAKKHRENIRLKLGVSSAVDAARVAARLGLGPTD